MQEKIRTIHVYFEEEELEPVVETDIEPEPEEKRTRHPILGICCILYLVFLCLGIPAWSLLLAPSYTTAYDTTLSRTLTLTLSLHPTTSQVQLAILPVIKKIEQVTVSASASVHQNGTFATGLITFYNGLFAPQTVPAGTKLKGRDGITAVTSQQAVIPAATPTTPPTYGTVSVAATSTVSGTPGNIPASDIDTACCGPSILAQNLYPFSGGQDKKDVPVLTKIDLGTGTQTLTSQVNAEVNEQAQKELQPGAILLPLTCSQSLASSHQTGDQAATAILTLKVSCTPLAYFAGDVAFVSQRVFPLPRGYHLVSFTALVLASHTTQTGGTLTMHAIAYLKQDRPTVTPYRFGGK